MKAKTATKTVTTMSDQERAKMTQLVAGLELGPIAGEQVLAQGRVFDFLEELYECMEEDGVTQAELARRMHVSPNQIHRWLSTESGMRAETQYLLARMMGYRLDHVWNRIEMASEPVKVQEELLAPNPTVDQQGGEAVMTTAAPRRLELVAPAVSVGTSELEWSLAS